jgi:glucans biosynthesis protein
MKPDATVPKKHRRWEYGGREGHVGALLLAIASIALPAAAHAQAAPAFGLGDVAARAKNLAEQAYQDPRGKIPDWLLQIDYDQWRNIRFRAHKALWKDPKRWGVQVQFFHPGLFYDRPVTINTVSNKGEVWRVPFDPSQFDYGRNDFASKVPQDLGFAGFRLHAPIKRKDYFDEVIVFLGATYFRAVGRDEVFGLSARGLAIDTALPSGEEFPYFREFWLVEPPPRAKEMTVYALLDSRSLTGAYQFVVRPGERTAVEVTAQLFLRKEVSKLGIAPLTSMFFHGENSARQFEDFRPEAHDSDGLLLHYESGEWLWRPLDNPRTLNVNGFRMHNPRGFGLIQRDRDFNHYQDLETRAEQRPSAWIVPSGDWGDGRVELVEIPTKSDTNDNIVTYWVPDKVPGAGGSTALTYTLYWFGEDRQVSSGGRVIATRRDRGNKPNAYRFVIDFDGKALRALPDDTVLRGVVTVASGSDAAEILDQHVVKNPVTKGWRLTLQVRPKQDEPIELRAFLDKGGETLTETWSYVLLP